MSDDWTRPAFFRSPAELRGWLAKHHATATQKWVGFRKRGTGERSITWPESVDEALCVGWIDGVRKRLDDRSYVIRFSPRKPGSIWSAVNIKRVEVLRAEKRMKAAGEKAFGARIEARSVIYAYEQKGHALDPASESSLRKNKAAWKFYSAQAAWYRRKASWWVASAKKEETRARRLAKLVAESAAGRQV
jgi:uncharacterized protein YdeI (YjbR/CyaY-like superfamily)